MSLEEAFQPNTKLTLEEIFLLLFLNPFLNTNLQSKRKATKMCNCHDVMMTQRTLTAGANVINKFWHTVAMLC